MNFISVVLLAVFQGIAEFLPISSSGHLAVLGNILGTDPEANFSLGIVLHAGTLAAILVFYFRSLLNFLQLKRNTLALMIILGSVPAGVLGVLFKSKVEAWAGSMWVVGGCFLVTAAILFFSEQLEKKHRRNSIPPADLDHLSWKQALGIGCAQAVALMPGISRSGSTISAGLAAGLGPEQAAEFSFLLAIPAIGGAAFLETLKLFRHGIPDGGGSPIMLGTGFLISAAVGYGALALLLKVLKKGHLSFFSIYLVLAAAAVLLREILRG